MVVGDEVQSIMAPPKSLEDLKDLLKDDIKVKVAGIDAVSSQSASCFAAFLN